MSLTSMDKHTERNLNKYYDEIVRVHEHFNSKRSRSAKSQHLSKMKESIQKDEWSPQLSFYNFMLEITEGFTKPMTYELTETNIHKEIIKYYNKKMIKYRGPVSVFADYYNVITYFNRSYTIPLPTKNMNQVKLYDKRLLRAIDTQTINYRTIYFLLFLIYV